MGRNVQNESSLSLSAIQLVGELRGPSLVVQDLMTNPLMVPLTSLRGHSNTSVMDIAFHPSQPWLFTAGEDAGICLFTN
jgi:WD40 repeat protein